jgi:hypothetical protein
MVVPGEGAEQDRSVLGRREHRAPVDRDDIVLDEQIGSHSNPVRTRSQREGRQVSQHFFDHVRLRDERPSIPECQAEQLARRAPPEPLPARSTLVSRNSLTAA